jgi:O-methyltransferase
MPVPDLRDRYLDLLRDSLLGLIDDDPSMVMTFAGGIAGFDREKRENGLDWPSRACSMIGVKRMLQLQRAAVFVIEKGIPGDFIETGVWRGGACILMRAVLLAWGDTDRHVWLADSFQGLPPPDVQRYPADQGRRLHEYRQLAVPLADVKRNFERYHLLDDQVAFLPGWFRDTLQTAPIDKLAILRLDGDLYESTIQALTALYDRVSVGGFVIIDDYGVFPNCRAAVTDFRNEHDIRDRIHDIDGSGVYWQRGVH